MHTSGTDGEADAKYASVQLARLEEISVSRRIHRVKSQLQRMDPTVAQPEYSRVFGDLLGLEQRRKVLLQRASGDF
jgi:DNA primase